MRRRVGGTIAPMVGIITAMIVVVAPIDDNYYVEEIRISIKYQLDR
jgi:hypothetical protein